MREHKSKSTARKAGKSNTSAESSSQMVVGSNLSRSRFLSTRNLRYLVAALCVVAVAFGLYFVFKKVGPKATSNACDAATMQRANSLNQMGNVTEFTYLAGKIKSLPKYDKDPNCMYALAEYQILNDDFSAAHATIEHLQSTYGSGHKYSQYLDGGKASMASLQKQYNQAKQAKDNSNGVIDPNI